MTKTTLTKQEQKEILEKAKKLCLSELKSQLDKVKHIRLFGSIIRNEFGYNPKGKKTSKGIRKWSDIDFLLIVKDGFKIPKKWKEKFKVSDKSWFCYYLPKGMKIKAKIKNKTVNPSVEFAFAVIYENALKDKAKYKRIAITGLPFKKSIFKKRYIRVK
ncbi:MAG: nucleotidyltransferase domain-containing protein [Nanoarchaeota archaeon]|nr:nucleotidyltransferase domain-containing protein [Nanoarchaeota archaeon]MBU1028491.1 nucleotidyltransferase domain-containing protein [Nanoarchaeota archaeon]